jgi:peptidoglycan/LPS O-acetylase OafA/YrhL
MEPAAKPERYSSLDGLRAAMMLLGIYIHAIAPFSTLPDVWWYRDAAAGPAFDLQLMIIHTFRMPVFFAMAGFFGALLLARKGPAEFMQNRGKRILLPLLASLALGIPLLKALQLVQRLLAATGGVRAQDFLAWYPRMLSDFNAGPYWFLLILVQFYVLALLLRPLGRLLPVGKAADTARKGVDRLFTSAWSPSVLALLSMAGLATVPAGVFPAPQGLVPELRILGVYGPFLLFGWLLYHRRHLLQGFVRGAWRHLGLGLLWMAATLAAVAVQLGNPAWKTAAFAATVVAGSLCVWELLFALLGLFQRYIGTELLLALPRPLAGPPPPSAPGLPDLLAGFPQAGRDPGPGRAHPAGLLPLGGPFHLDRGLAERPPAPAAHRDGTRPGRPAAPRGLPEPLTFSP